MPRLPAPRFFIPDVSSMMGGLWVCVRACVRACVCVYLCVARHSVISWIWSRRSHLFIVIKHRPRRLTCHRLPCPSGYLVPVFYLVPVGYLVPVFYLVSVGYLVSVFYPVAGCRRTAAAHSAQARPPGCSAGFCLWAQRCWSSARPTAVWTGTSR